jgi:hypothetical protein
MRRTPEEDNAIEYGFRPGFKKYNGYSVFTSSGLTNQNELAATGEGSRDQTKIVSKKFANGEYKIVSTEVIEE